MTVDAIGFLPAGLPLQNLSATGELTTPAASSTSFADWFGTRIEATNSQLVSSEQGLQSLASGETTSLHHVMIGLEEARLGFQLVTQVRNHLLDAYQEVMRMQI
jgi:flagellar hook-basal body complex protein FliE